MTVAVPDRGDFEALEERIRVLEQALKELQAQPATTQKATKYRPPH
jgi:hypothetical protein